MNRNFQIGMTNDEIRRKTEIRMTNEPLHPRAPLDIRASDFFRHWSLVIGHSTTGSWSQCTAARPRGLPMNLRVRVPALAGPERGRSAWGLSMNLQFSNPKDE